MHLRSQIRTALYNLFVGLPSLGANVYPSRAWALQTNLLPAVTISTTADDVDSFTLAALSVFNGSKSGRGRTYIRSLTILLTIKAIPTGDYEAAIDAIALELERAIEDDPTLGGLCKPLTLANTTIRLSNEGENVIAVGELTYTVTYSHYGPYPDNQA